jgi:hypothetical protein
MNKQGFFAIINDEYVGPFERLNQARDEARKFGSDIQIFHGVLLEDEKFDGKIIPKIIDN